MENTILTLPQKKWFYMVRSGEKTEEYREITPYWCNRLLDLGDHNMRIVDCFCERIEFMIHESLLKIRQFSRVTFTLGYPKAEDMERRMTFNNPKIRIGTGRPEWGAKPVEKYFIITWDKKKIGKEDYEQEGFSEITKGGIHDSPHTGHATVDKDTNTPTRRRRSELAHV